MENKREKNFKELTGGCVGLIAAMVISMAFTGYVVTYLWNGIISPTFDVMTLTFWQGYGLNLVTSYLTATIKPKEDGYSTAERFIVAMSLSAAFWGLGWIVIQFI